VPTPLWSITLANISTIAPELGLVICDGCDEIIKKIHDYWIGLNRKGKCQVCGSEASEIDEDWRYYVYYENKPIVDAREIDRLDLLEKLSGIAYLKGLRLLCHECHLAKHQGYASIVNKKEEAIKQLAKVNEMDYQEAEFLVNEAFYIHSIISRIRNWSIKIGNLKGLTKKEKESFEHILNSFYSKNFYLENKRLYFSSKGKDQLDKEAIDETIKLIELIKNKGISIEEIREAMLSELKKLFEHYDIRVLDEEFKLFMKYLLENDCAKTVFDKAFNDLEEAKEFLDVSNFCNKIFGGEWYAFIPKSSYVELFSSLMRKIENSGYSIEILAANEDYQQNEELPIAIHIPSALATNIVVSSARILRNSLEEFNIKKGLFFKPNLFIKRQISQKYKSYIYSIKFK